jgi:hypothetical protein
MKLAEKFGLDHIQQTANEYEFNFLKSKVSALSEALGIKLDNEYVIFFVFYFFLS